MSNRDPKDIQDIQEVSLMAIHELAERGSNVYVAVQIGLKLIGYAFMSVRGDLEKTFIEMLLDDATTALARAMKIKRENQASDAADKLIEKIQAKH